jgi:hypothetical protein
VFLLITGHGYQEKSTSDNHEIDGMDEYIKSRSGKITDDDLFDIFVRNECVNLSAVIDTCHSGTMLDINRKKSTKNHCISISACRDEQLAMCDVGNICGFGGSLVIQLIDNDFLKYFINFDIQNIKKSYRIISRNLSKLQQSPQLWIK